MFSFVYLKGIGGTSGLPITAKCKISGLITSIGFAGGAFIAGLCALAYISGMELFDERMCTIPNSRITSMLK